MSLTHREAIKAKIRALLAKNEARGCTEAEAASAAAKAADLMHEHDLAYDDVEEVKSERYGARKRDVNCNIKRVSLHEVSSCAKAIGQLFNCKVWRNSDKRQRVFFGTEYDTETAHNLYNMIALAMETEFRSYLADPDRDNWHLHGRTIRPSFMTGMASRLKERIRTIILARETADAETQVRLTGMSTALVTITKRQLVSEKYVSYAAEHRLHLQRTAGKRINIHSSHADAAGRSAADRTDLGGTKISNGRKMLGAR